MRRLKRSTDNRVYAWPLVIAVTTIAGLVAALIGAGIFDWFSWAALSLPPAIVAFALGRAWTAPSRNGER